MHRNSKAVLSFSDVNLIALGALPSILNRWLPNGKVQGTEYVALNPKRADSSPGSFKINLCTGKWADFATGDRGGDIISLAAYIFDIPQSEAKHRVEGMMEVHHA